MTDIEIAVGLLIRRMTSPEQDGTLDAALRLVHEVITTKLGGDPALERLELEAHDSGEIRPRTRTRLAMALEDAAEDDPDFARELETAVNEAQKSGQVEAVERPTVHNEITGNVSGRVIQAHNINGSVTFHSDAKGR